MKIKDLGTQPYQETLQAMQVFTDQRDADTEDEIWLLEHPPVYTLGQASKAEHILNRNHIPLVQSNRGGQVTYHGPGQLIAYTLLDMRRLKLGIRQLVVLLENVVIQLLADHGIKAYGKRDAPGVYVDEAKIASIGLRVRRGCTFHGLALNVNMDLSPFADINPCGYAGLQVTQLKDFAPEISMDAVKSKLSYYFTADSFAL